MEFTQETRSPGSRPERSSASFPLGLQGRASMSRSGSDCSTRPPSDSGLGSPAKPLQDRTWSEAGNGRISILVATLVDTNVLVYRYDPRFPDKQKKADSLLRSGIALDNLCLPHQAIVEFMAVVTRTLPGIGRLLPPHEARREAEEMLNQFVVLYPVEEIVRLALRGAAMYQLSWFDAHLWAYAEHYGLPELLSEDFEHGRRYGTVRVRNPFVERGLA